MMVNVDLLLALLRVFIGLLFLGHGAQKLFGWFGGPGMSGQRQMMESLDMQPAPTWAWVSALSEFVGGALLVLGLATPLAAAAITVVMVAAIFKVHWSNGFWNMNGGYEFNLLILVSTLVIALAGSNVYSLDRWIGLGWSPWFYVVGVIAGLGALVWAEQQEAEPVREEQSRQTS